MYYTYAKTQLGPILLTSDGKTLTGLYWKVFRRAPTPEADWVEDAAAFADVLRELDEYLAGKRQHFDVPYRAEGTAFQKQVWQALEQIPFGASASYREIATAIGRPKAVRAVGTAVGSNPVCIIVPCHRALGSGQTLNGYAGGLDAKRALLKLEHIPYVA